MKKNPFPLPFLDSILGYVVRPKMYSFMDNYIGYNQVKMVEMDKKKMTFISEWGVYAYNVICCLAYVMFQQPFKK